MTSAPCPRNIASKAAFENAMSLDIAMGGSTNTVLHLLAAAQEGEIDFTMSDIDRLSRRVPNLCKVAPSSHFHLEDVHRAGGVMSILGELERAQLLDASVPTVHANSLRDALGQWDITRTEDPTVHEFFRAGPAGIRTQTAFSQSCRYSELDVDRKAGCIRSRDHAYSQDGGLAVLYGNLAERGCIVKTAGVDKSILKFSGPAVVIESQDAAVEMILTGRVKAGDVVVIRYEGPRGGPGMQEMLYPTSYLKSKGLGKSLRTHHRRALFRRHGGLVDRPCVPRSRRRGKYRADRDRRHRRDRHSEPHRALRSERGGNRAPSQRPGRQGLEAGTAPANAR